MVDITDLPIVVDKTRTQNLGGESGARQTMELGIKKQSEADLQKLVQLITIEETDKQERAGNPISHISVDNQPNKPLHDVKYKTVVIYGSLLQKALIHAVETVLSRTIRQMRYDTGALADIKHNWEWIYLPGKGKSASSVNPLSLDFIPQDARLILRPKLDYAWLALRLMKQHTGFQGGYAAATARSPRQGQGAEGFMALTTQKLRRSRHFKNAFSVYAAFSKKNIPSGEGKMFPHGAPIIVVRPRIARAKRRVRV